MFQFPRYPSPALCVRAGSCRHKPARVAPFGNPRIVACQPLPEAFRRVAAPFIGPAGQGIHRVPIHALAHRARSASSPAPGRGRRVHQTRQRRALPRAACGRGRRHDCTRFPRCSLALLAVLLGVPLSRCVGWDDRTDATAHRPRPGGAEGARTPSLRRARAALSQLSYGPRVPSVGAHRSGRAWTRTRDLGLIRAAL